MFILFIIVFITFWHPNMYITSHTKVSITTQSVIFLIIINSGVNIAMKDCLFEIDIIYKFYFIIFSTS